MTRVAVLWDSPTGYLFACLEALREAGADVFLVHEPCRPDTAPFEFNLGSVGGSYLVRPALAELIKELNRFGPDIVLVSGWSNRRYLAASILCHAASKVICFDARLPNDTLRISLTRPAGSLLRRVFDYAFVPGGRQVELARAMGFESTRIITGLYAADMARFQYVADVGIRDRTKAFIFVGRLIDSKGLTTLAKAYERYREAVPDPWALVAIGNGPLGQYLRLHGISVHGFVQPNMVACALAEGRCFVMPSHYDPWNVALHEAAAAGLPLIATNMVGSADTFVAQGLNGLIVPAGDATALGEALEQMSCLEDQMLEAMSRYSSVLANQTTPAKWASAVFRMSRGT